MAENTKSKKAESLNDRHHRFLQNLSTPHLTSSKPSFGLFEEEEELEDQQLNISAEGSTNVCKASRDDSIPKFSFSGISDSDSSVPTKGERSSNSVSNIDTQYEDAYSEALEVGDDAGKSQLSETEFYSTKEQKEKSSNSLSDDDGHFEDCFETQGAEYIKSQLSKDTEQKSSKSLSGGDSHFYEASSAACGGDEEVKPEKVKIKGRRRLCKVSTRDGGNIDNKDSINSVEKVDLAEPEYLEASDFDLTPPRAKGINENQQNDGASEIRDIMDELTSRLDFLSIEKKHKSKAVDHVKIMQNEPRIVKPTSEVYKLKEKNDSGIRINERGRMTDMSAGQSVQYSVEEHTQSRFQNESERRGFVNRLEDTRNVLGKAKTKCSTRGDKIHEDMKKYIVLETEEEDGDDDCVILSRKKEVGNNEMHQRKLSNCDDADLVDDPEEIEKIPIIMTGLKGTYKLPGKIASMLYPHQRDGLKWLWSLHCNGKGGILGDDMGLGKTMQMCGYLAGLFHSNLIKRALVVAPTTLLSHWIKELRAVGLSSKIREYYGTNIKTRNYELQCILQDKGVLLTTYDIVRNNTKSLKGHAYSGFESEEDEIVWDYMILDEGHLIKNPNTQRAKSLLEIPSGHRIIISGTPLQNNLKELWALFSFCCPELLGDKKWFKDTYESFILRGNEKNASERERRIGSTVAKELREKIQPFFLRRLKTEVFGDNDDNKTAKLSKKNEIIIWLKLTRCQRQLYEAFLNSELVLSAFDGSPLAALTILKKICDHPLLLTKRAAEDVLEGMDSMLNPQEVGMAEKLAKHIADVAERDGFEENHDNISCKLSFILSLLDNLIPEGHNVLIFSQTCKMLDLIQVSLRSCGYDYVRIDGKTKICDRAKIVDDFQEGNGPPIFLLTSQVGGLGLTLTKADRVIVVDPAWNPSTDNQSVDRAYRIGQKNDVIVYRLMTCGTVEEKIYRKQIFKGGLFRIATEHKEQMRYFSQQDLRDMFSLPKYGFDVSPTQQQLHREHGNQLIMNDFLKSHVQFLGTLDIGGVSHHTLLFSKTEPVESVPEEHEMIRKTPTYVGTSSAKSTERPIDGAEYAFKPKDVQLSKRASTPNSADKLSESDIKLKINRLSQMVSNAAMVSRLPDKGERLRRQINDLNAQLMQVKMDRDNKHDVIELDAITGKLDYVLRL